jgi:hypothetical protein
MASYKLKVDLTFGEKGIVRGALNIGRNSLKSCSLDPIKPKPPLPSQRVGEE